MKTAINAFIAAYLAVAWCWRLPPSSFGRRLIEPIAGFLQWAGLEQGWSMFSPDPPQAEHELLAVIRLRSGRGVVWEPPRTHMLSRWAAFVKFRYREYASTMLSDAAAPFRPALVDYLLRKYDFADDPPAEVILTCRRTPVPAPGGSARPEPPATFIVHTHVVGGPS